VRAGDYTVEAAHTRVQFKVDHMGFTDWYGDFTNATGTLSIDPANPAAGKVDVSIPTGSISTTNSVLDGILRSKDWFDAATHPAIRFVSTKIEPTGPDTARVTGNFMLHGVTKTLTLDAHFNGAGLNPITHMYDVGFNLTGKISRSAFGVTAYVPVIGDEVDIKISAAFERKP
jgi:polyisoprenoid-binding protein YceI